MLKIEDLKEGEIYYRNYFIFIHVKIDPYKCNNTAISIRDNRFYNANAAMDLYNKNPDRLATPEEKHWLNECIKVNKFIPYEEAIKTFKKENKSLIGRYLKYIGKSENFSKYGDYFKIITDKRGANLLRLSDNVPNCIWFGTGELLSNPKNDYWELMPEEWVPEKENTPQFEVGKWYTHPKWSPNSYIKFSSIRDYNSVFELERISQGSYKGRNTNWSISYEHTLEEAKMEVVSQFLPDNHPDKITKQENYEYEVVHCKTQEEWNFVISKIGDLNLKYLESTDSEGKINCLNFKNYAGASLKWYQNKNSKIYSFEEWCNKFGYKPDFMNKQEEYKVGSYVIVHNLTGVSSNAKIGSLAIITKKPYNESYFIDNVGIDVKWINLKDINGNSIPLNQQNNGGYSLNMFRLALPHEIPQETNSIPSNNDDIEVGDEVETNCPNTGEKKVIRGIVAEVDKNYDIQPCIKMQDPEIWFYSQNSKDYIKIIKKASQTTTTYEKQVAEQPKNVPITTDIRIPKSISVTLTNAEKEVKLTIKKPKTIKI